MKDKPVSHKNQNTFRFLTFSERISKINIDVIHQIGRTSASPEDANTFFLEAVEKWVDLNYSQDFGDLQKEIGPEIRNLSQIVFRQNEIITILLKYLNKEESLALDAVFELIIALARDLQCEFYPHFHKFFSAIVRHLSTKDTDLLEKLFTCLAYLFKFLWKYMLKDIENVYRLFSSLLSNENKEHIRIFAVESFAFLIRKVQNRRKLFDFIFQELQKNPDQSSGVGLLFFEVIKGVKEQFHSCTENVLKLLFEFLGCDNQLCDLIQESLVQTVTAMAKHTTKKHCIIVQNIFCDVIKELLSNDKNDDTITQHHLNCVLCLFLIWINFKNGKLISSDSMIVQILIDLCGKKDLPCFCMKTIAEIVVVVIISDCLSLTFDYMNTITALMYSQIPEVYIYFTRKILKYKMFEKDILSHLLSACIKLIQMNGTKKLALQILAETVVALKPAITTGETIRTFTKLYFCIPDKDILLEDFLLKVLSPENVSKPELSNLWAALVCLPHMRSLNSHVFDTLQKLAVHLQKHIILLDDAGYREIEEYSFVLCQLYFTYVIIKKDNNDDGCFNTAFFVQLLKRYSKSVSILRIADLHFSRIRSSVKVDDLIDFLPNIIPNLASPFHLIRLFTLKILNTFTSSFCEDNQACSILTICLEAEKIPLDVQSYRDKLKLLRKLEYQFLEKEFLEKYEGFLKKIPIFYLIGMLFVNFRLLWDPAIDIVETYAHGTTKIFWDVYGSYLHKITEMCEEKDFQFEELFEVDEVENEVSIFHQSLLQFCRVDENPDIGNHRILLWKAMEKFPEVVEPKNKIIVPLIFKLMANEITKLDSTLASKESLTKDADLANYFSSDKKISEGVEGSSNKNNRKHKQKQSIANFKKRKYDNQTGIEETGVSKSREKKEISETEDTDESDNVSESDEEISEDELDDDDQDQDLNPEVDRTKTKKNKSYVKRKYSVAKTLAAYLCVFSKFKGPKSLYRAEDLLKLYNELLTYYDPLIQKLSFDCIVTYNFKYLVSYKENFYRILDNKTFKSEVVLFSLDKQNEIIREEDRKNVLPVLMRILYGKMLHKTGNHTTGKSQANARRSLVLRFLAGCTADELRMFFNLVFMPFQEFLNEDTLLMVKKVRNFLDLSNIVPLRRQHSALNSLGMILQHLGNLVPELLPWLLKVLLAITATSMTLLEKRDEVLPHCVNLLKSVRTLAILKLIQFFKIFSKYEFHPNEIDAIFEAIVWPMLPRLELESVNQPSPLLRLFSTWSENPRYFILFSKYKNCKSFTAMPHLIALYSSSRAKPRVVRVVSQIIFNLITSEISAKTEDENIVPVNVNFVCLPYDVTSEKGTLSYGTKLLLPYVDNILQRLETTILASSKTRSKKFLSSRDLTILLRISCHIKDSEQCFKLINLLVPFLYKPKIDADSEIVILTTISNLIQQTEDPEGFLKLFAPLFGKLTNQNSRSALTNVFTTIAQLQKNFSQIAIVISKINAYDSNLVEEPDYQQRLDGHQEALEIIQCMSKSGMNEHFVRIIIFNSSFMIRTLDDMALRNSSSYLLSELTKAISTLQNKEPELFNLLIFDTLLPEIHKGFKCISEIKRHEFICVLSSVLEYCKDQPRLKELVALSHSDKDLDFWANIRHLQVHRRARALLRFSSTLKNQHGNKEKINTHYLLTYMIPIVQSFLFDEAYKKSVHVIDAAIETLGSIANVLPWHHYEHLLKQYLDLISKDADHHKTIIKIIVSLLDAFPYDLKAVESFVSSQSVESNDTSEKNMQEKQICTPEKESDSSALKNTLGFDELTPELIKKINGAIRKNILPMLHKSLMKKSKHDDEHKLAGHYYPEDEEILRVPIALAMIKLLQKLPSGTLEKALPGLLLKMCELLKSRTESIRLTTRETLVKMMESLGPKYFYFLLKEMKGVMTKGYQVHVMIFTINAVLTHLTNQLNYGDLDDCLKDLSQICMNELFSDIAEEKEVTKITGKVKEARSTKSYSILQIISKYISENLLLDLILPLKEMLFTKHSHNSLKKISECFRHVAVGLSENGGVSEKGLLIFIHSVASEHILSLNPKRNKPSSKYSKYERPDIYLVPKEPGRSGPPAKISKKTNIHMLVEFGLQILQYCLKKDKISKGEHDILEMLDPFVSLLSQCLLSNHAKIISTALRCLLPFYKYPLPSFKDFTKNVIESLFILINKYASPGMGQGENFEMIVMCFKMLTVLVRDTNYHKFSEDQLQSLLSYIEQDIYDYTKQATAFSLLKAILSKKMESSQLPSIMSKVAEMAITSEQENIRAQCRQLCMQYMLDYPLGKKIIKSISFFIAQLEYFHEHGRISCMEIINSMINMFPENVLKNYSALFLVPLSARLVNDDSPQCRKMSAQCIKKLLEKSGHDGRAGLFSVALKWLQSKKLSHKRLGVQLCGLFAEVEGEKFEHHLIEVLPTYCELTSSAANTEVEKRTDERCTDHFLYHLLNSLTKMLSFCSHAVRNPEYSEIFNEFWKQLQEVVLYPHMWVRLAVNQLFGLLLSSYTVEEVYKAVIKEDKNIYINSRQKLRDLSADFSTQIQSPYLNEMLGEQIVRNLIYLARVISKFPDSPKSTEEVQVTLSWMIRKMCKEAKREVAETPNISLRRKYVFLFIAGITHELGKKAMLPYLNLILIPLCREVSDSSKSTNENMKKDAQETLDLIKTVMGVEDFSSHYAAVQMALLKKKIKRKRDKAQEAVTDPERYSKRKIKKQQSKKESKKRKILKQKGKKKTKKAKLADIAIAS